MYSKGTHSMNNMKFICLIILLGMTISLCAYCIENDAVEVQPPTEEVQKINQKLDEVNSELKSDDKTGCEQKKETTDKKKSSKKKPIDFFKKDGEYLVFPDPKGLFGKNSSDDKRKFKPKKDVELWPSYWPTEGVESVDIYVSKDPDDQNLIVVVNGKRVDAWHVSTGKPPLNETPDLNAVPVHSMKWNAISTHHNSPMNWAVFIQDRLIALHATPEDNYSKLGDRASLGCIRNTENRAYWLHNYIGVFRDKVHVTVKKEKFTEKFPVKK